MSGQTRGGATDIRQLAIIGDRRTCAMVGIDGCVSWYCPGRFDRPSLLAGLLDQDKGGAWTLALPDDAQTGGRSYVEDSAVLQSHFALAGDRLTVTDWMPMGDGCPRGICRLFSRAPQSIGICLRPAPDYARAELDLRLVPGGVCINGRHWVYASHPLSVEDGAIRLDVAAGEEGWTFLADAPVRASRADLEDWLAVTVEAWREVASHITYHGPFERQVAQSLRALRLMTYEPNGGIIAAATTSIPEVPQGTRNYDYRYLWMRDTGMIISALVRAGSDGPDERRFLDFICGSRQDRADWPLLPPFVSLDFEPAPHEIQLELAGYQCSRPVRVGNNANKQFQLDGLANVLLAAKLIYRRHDTREHWDTVSRIADLLAERWREPDYGIWEEHEKRQYTTGKVITSCGLHYIAEFAEDAAQAERWRTAAREIQAYVARSCMTSEGAYAVYAGSEAVDVSAVLFPIWGYTDPESPEMIATIRVLERDYAKGDLYWRHLEELGRFQEGAFLAGSIWVAQYWVMRKDLKRARDILECMLGYATDLGFLPEEANPTTSQMLGNIPQTFVHAALIGAVLDYKAAGGA